MNKENRSMNFEQIVWNYDAWKAANPGLDIIENIKEGDKIKKTAGLKFIVDSLEIADELNEKGEMVDFEKIYNHFSGDEEQTHALFNGRKEIPFSEAYKNNTGQCLERALTANLIMRDSDKIERNLLIIGGIKEESERGSDYHAYNIIKNDHGWILFDSSCPLIREGKFKPYVAKIEGIELTGGLPLKLKEHYQTNRIYSLV